jgi:hypothetical protein
MKRIIRPFFPAGSSSIEGRLPRPPLDVPEGRSVSDRIVCAVDASSAARDAASIAADLPVRWIWISEYEPGGRSCAVDDNPAARSATRAALSLTLFARSTDASTSTCRA